MLTCPKRWMHLALLAGLVVGVALFVGCGGGSDSGDGDGGGSSDRGGGDAGNGGGNPGGGSVSIDHGSPEALFDSMLSAAQREDFGAVAACYSPAIQRDMAAGMVSMAATADMNPMVNKEDVVPVLERHGIAAADLPEMGPQMQSQAEALADGLENRTAFIGDMMGLMPDMLQGFNDTFGDPAAGATSLTDLQVDGDTASAQITVAGQDSGEDRRVEFVRIDGKWYVTDQN